MMAGHTRRCPIVCAIEGLRLHDTLDVVKLYVLSKGDDGMPCPMSSYHVCSQRTIMACHVWHRPSVFAVQGAMMVYHTWLRQTVYVVQGPWWHAMTDIVCLYVQSKDNNGILWPSSTHLVCCPRAMITCHALRVQSWLLSKGYNVNPRMTFFYRLYLRRATKACHAGLLSTVCVVQGWWWNTTIIGFRPCVTFTRDDWTTRPSSFIHVCSKRAIMACHD